MDCQTFFSPIAQISGDGFVGSVDVVCIIQYSRHEEILRSITDRRTKQVLRSIIDTRIKESILLEEEHDNCP